LNAVDARIAVVRASGWSRTLPALSVAERENWALGRYSGKAHGKDFYTPTSTRTGWIVNPNMIEIPTDDNSNPRTYVNRVRERASALTGDSGVLVGEIPGY
jgi:hypothetical protein